MHKIKKLILITTLLAAGDLFADSIQIVQPIQTSTASSAFVSQQDTQNQAQQWGLNLQDYQHYLWLMKNTSSNKWYVKLDPAEVLALNANDQAEMMRYAQIQARNMHNRVTRELIFNKMYTTAYKKLYPTEKPIQSNLIKSVTTNGLALQAGDRIWLFTGTNTPLSNFIYQRLIKEAEQTPNAALDIYFVGYTLTQQSIQQWAVANNIPRNMVNQQLTLNFGNDRFQSVTKGKAVNLPYVGIVHDQRFQPINLSSLL